MKFNEIKELIEATNGYEIEVKKYLPFIKKTMFVNDMMVGCIDNNEHNMQVIDFTQKRFCFDVYLMRDYVGIEFDRDDVIDQYDYLKSNGWVDYVYEQIDARELSELQAMVEDSIKQEVSISNSLEGVVNKGIKDLISKIPETGKIDKWIKSAVKSIEKFDPSKHEKLNELLAYAKGENEKVVSKEE